MKKKLYIGCALTHLPEDKKEGFLNMVEEVKKELRKNFEVIAFWNALSPDHANLGTPQDVYDYDIRKCLMQADCMLAICDYYGLGLGYEIATAVEKMGIPVLAMAHNDSLVSRLIRGIDRPNFHFARYNSPLEIIEKALEFLTSK